MMVVGIVLFIISCLLAILLWRAYRKGIIINELATCLMAYGIMILAVISICLITNDGSSHRSKSYDKEKMEWINRNHEYLEEMDKWVDDNR